MLHVLFELARLFAHIIFCNETSPHPKWRRNITKYTKKWSRKKITGRQSDGIRRAANAQLSMVMAVKLLLNEHTTLWYCIVLGIWYISRVFRIWHSFCSFIIICVCALCAVCVCVVFMFWSKCWFSLFIERTKLSSNTPTLYVLKEEKTI